MLEEFRRERESLNPVFVRPGDDLTSTIRQAFKEALRGYFSPLLLIVFVVKLAGQNLKTFVLRKI